VDVFEVGVGLPLLLDPCLNFVTLEQAEVLFGFEFFQFLQKHEDHLVRPVEAKLFLDQPLVSERVLRDYLLSLHFPLVRQEEVVGHRGALLVELGHKQAAAVEGVFPFEQIHEILVVERAVFELARAFPGGGLPCRADAVFEPRDLIVDVLFAQELVDLRDQLLPEINLVLVALVLRELLESPLELDLSLLPRA